MTTLLLDLTRDDVGHWFHEHGARLFGAIFLALVGAWIVGRLVTVALKPAVARQMAGRDPVEVQRRVETLANVIQRTAQVVFVLLALFTIMAEFGFNIGPVLAAAGIIGIALGFGAQTLVRDTINGFFILGENQFARGDIVRVAEVSGVVEDVTLRRTLVRDADGVLYSVPNGAISVAANYTRDFAQVRVLMPVAHGSDLAKVREICDRIGRELALDPQYEEMITAAPAFERVESIDWNGIGVRVTGTVRPGAQWDVGGALRARLLAALAAEGVKTPWG